MAPCVQIEFTNARVGVLTGGAHTTTMINRTLSTDRIWDLPPLILHPVSVPSAPEKLAQGSRASLVLRGLIDDEGLGLAEWRRRLLDCRYCEVRILFFLGRDLGRWVGQCAEIAERDLELSNFGVRKESFAHLLVSDPPQAIAEKMLWWGVRDCGAVFRHALGLSIAFETLPASEVLAEEFLCHHRRYAGALFETSQGAADFALIRGLNFHFELYASVEYARLLEAEWES
jgi:hypothetical protein